MTNNQELPINNPAERLLVILQRLASENKTQTTLKVFSIILGTEESFESFFTQGIIQILKLIDCIEQQIIYFPDPKAKSSQYSLDDIKNELSKVVSLAVANDKWSNAINFSNQKWYILTQSLPHLVYDLELFNLSIKKEQLIKLQNDVESLINEVVASDIDDDLKKFLRLKLENIKVILDKYYKYGNNTFNKEVMTALKELEIKSGELQDKLTEKDITILEKFKKYIWKSISILGAIDILVSSPANIHQIESWGEEGIKSIGHAEIEQIEDIPKLPPSSP